MPTMRAVLALIAMGVAGACSDGEPRQAGKGDAGEEEEMDAEAPSSEHAAEAADAAAEVADAAVEATDAAADDAALDAAASERDGETTATMDATPNADATSSDDVAVLDAGEPCTVEAGADSSCVAHLCNADGGIALALEQDEPWRIGALDWTATLCGRSLGWPAAATSDARQLVYSLTSADLQQIQQGAPVQTYYGGPGTAPGLAALDCTLEFRSPVPACRVTPK